MSETVTSLDELAQSVRSITGAADDNEQRFVPGHWHSKNTKNIAPATIRSPEEFTGGDRISISCTQTELSARDQKALVKSWCESLPAMQSLRTVWFTSKVPQELFDAACSLPLLEGLYLKWNGIKKLDSISSLDTLKFLHLGGSSSVESLAPLSGMRQLEWLQINNPTKAFDLEPLSTLSGLAGLGFTGLEGKKHHVPSLRPLESLTALRWLHLGAVHVADGSLKPLAFLKKLEWLGLGNFFPTEEFASLSIDLPNTYCDWLAPYATYHRSVFPCRKCKANWKVMTSGRSGQLLCPTCDNVKLAKHIIRFRSAQSAAEARNL